MAANRTKVNTPNISRQQIVHELKVNVAEICIELYKSTDAVAKVPIILLANHITNLDRYIDAQIVACHNTASNFPGPIAQVEEEIIVFLRRFRDKRRFLLDSKAGDLPQHIDACATIPRKQRSFLHARIDQIFKNQ